MAPAGYISIARHVRAFGVVEQDEMTGTTRSSDGLDERRKRLLFRCWHRGTREMDLILGRFADDEIARLTDNEIVALESLLEIPEPDLYAVIVGSAELRGLPDSGSLIERLKAYRGAEHSA